MSTHGDLNSAALDWTVDAVSLIWRNAPPDDVFWLAEQLPLGREEAHT